ncbi:hypothetical protein JTE90_006875, partial [Oedothorax gibbosus]
ISSSSNSSSDEEECFPEHESMVIKEKDHIFVIYIKMEDFKPEDVAVYIQDNLLLVEGIKAGVSPNSFLRSSRFNWEFNIPDEIDIDSVNSFDILPGRLKIVCPKTFTTAID